MFPRRLLAFLGLMSLSVAAGCSEKLEAGLTCPELCPQNQVLLQDTVLAAITMDSTVPGFPAIGTESFLFLASLGDTLDTRAVARYDTLPSTYSLGGTDSTIRMVDSATVLLRVDTTFRRPAGPVTIEAYDLGDTTTADTVTAALLPFFTPARLIGSKTFAPESLVDSIKVPLSNAVVLDRLTRIQALRVGFRVRSDRAAAIRLYSSAAVTGAMRLRFRVSQDTAVAPLTVAPGSRTPSNPSLAFLKSALANYLIVAKGPSLPSAPLFSIGGLPGERTYVRFDIPAKILDSARIVRASLLLVQAPNRSSPEGRDTLYVQPLPLLAGRAVTDVAQALRLASQPGTYGLDSSRVVPLDSGAIEIQLVPLVQRWALTPTDSTPHAIALRSNTEGRTGQQVLFYSIGASPALRPRLRLTYVPHVTFGLP